MTLVEVLVAIALIMTLTGAMLGFLHDMLSSRAQALEAIASERAAATVLEHVERHLTTCIVGDAVAGPGVRGDGRSLRVLSRGVSVRSADRGAGAAAALGDLTVFDLRFDASRGLVEAMQTPWGAQDDASHQSLGGAVGDLRLRYWDGSGWLDEFDSLAAGRFPRAIEVAIWFGDPAPVEPGIRPPSDASGAPSFDPSLEVEPEPPIEAEAPEQRRRAPDRLQVITLPDAGAAS